MTELFSQEKRSQMQQEILKQLNITEASDQEIKDALINNIISTVAKDDDTKKEELKSELSQKDNKELLDKFTEISSVMKEKERTVKRFKISHLKENNKHSLTEKEAIRKIKNIYNKGNLQNKEALKIARFENLVITE